MAKREAVADEDYDKAKEIKDEVDSLKIEIEEKVSIFCLYTLSHKAFNMRSYCSGVEFSDLAVLTRISCYLMHRNIFMLLINNTMNINRY
jgi:UvrB/uvrC motif